MMITIRSHIALDVYGIRGSLEKLQRMRYVSKARLQTKMILTYINVSLVIITIT